MTPPPAKACALSEKLHGLQEVVCVIDLLARSPSNLWSLWMLHNEQTESPNIPLCLKRARPHGLAFNAKAHNGIARRAGRSPSEARKLPKRQTRSPREMVGYGRPMKASPWEFWMYDKPSGVVRGECRGGLGGAAAPNRPPSAARRAGGPNSRNEKPPCPQGTQAAFQRTSPALLSLEALPRKFRHPAAQAAQT